VRLGSLGTSTTDWPIVPAPDYKCGALGGMRIVRRKPAPASLRSPQIPHDLTWDQTRAAAVGIQRLTA
jgi:hypothetical protein